MQLNSLKIMLDNPFFLYLSYNAPHTPLQATKKDLERNKHIDIEKEELMLLWYRRWMME